MDKKLKVILIGLGEFGKKYFKELKLNKKFKISLILKKKAYFKTYKTIPLNSIKNIKTNLLNKIDLVIIATPIETHYNLANFFLKKKIPIILEKPAASTLSQIKILNNLSEKNKTSVFVNHTDTFNIYFKKILKEKKRIGKIKSIKAIYGKHQANKYFFHSKPHEDWLPHPFSIIKKFIDLDLNILKVDNNLRKIKRYYMQNLKVKFIDKKKINVEINYSNIKKLKNRKLIVYGNNGFLYYDGVNQNENFICIKGIKIFIKSVNYSSPIQNLLNFSKKKIDNKIFFNNLNEAISIKKIINKINTKIL